MFTNKMPIKIFKTDLSILKWDIHTLLLKYDVLQWVSWYQQFLKVNTKWNEYNVITLKGQYDNSENIYVLYVSHWNM
jgi:hypothetical protein